MIGRAWNIYQNEGIKPLYKKAVSKYLTPPPQYRVYNRLWELKNGSGIPMMERDWDNLIILDACRYDEFKSMNPFNKRVNKRVSLASNTTGFLAKNFVGKQHFDTVYVTANPKSVRLAKGDMSGKKTFHYTDLLIENSWDEETHTVLPKTVTKKALRAQGEFPKKRLIIHFLQPHLPYLGQKASEIRSKKDVSIGGMRVGQTSYIDSDGSIDMNRIRLKEASEYDISDEELREMYRETLEIALSSVEVLVEGLSGKTVITADHGEMFGERIFPLSKRIYEHPQGLRTDQLCIVPWLEFNSDFRRKTVEEEPINQNDEYDDDLIKDRLTALGYQ